MSDSEETQELIPIEDKPEKPGIVMGGVLGISQKDHDHFIAPRKAIKQREIEAENNVRRRAEQEASVQEAFNTRNVGPIQAQHSQNVLGRLGSTLQNLAPGFTSSSYAPVVAPEYRPTSRERQMLSQIHDLDDKMDL